MAETILVLIDDIRCGGIRPLFKRRAEILFSGSDQGLELFRVVKMRQLGHLPYEIIQKPLSFIGDFIVDKRDGLIRYRRHEASRKSFEESHPHLVKLIESAIDIDLSVLIRSMDMVNYVLHEC